MKDSDLFHCKMQELMQMESLTSTSGSITYQSIAILVKCTSLEIFNILSGIYRSSNGSSTVTDSDQSQCHIHQTNQGKRLSRAMSLANWVSRYYYSNITSIGKYQTLVNSVQYSIQVLQRCFTPLKYFCIDLFKSLFGVKHLLSYKFTHLLIIAIQCSMASVLLIISS